MQHHSDIYGSRHQNYLLSRPDINVGGAVTGEASYYFELNEGRTYLDLLVMYDPVASSQNSMRCFVDSKQTHQANLY